MGIARNAELILAQINFGQINLDGLEKAIEILLVIADDIGGDESAKNTAVVNMSFGDRETTENDRRKQCGYIMSKSTICFL